MSTSKENIAVVGAPTETADSIDSTESLGAWLARARAGQGAEPRDIARHLGLNPTLILALEANDFAKLGPAVFVRGYLSRYARVLNLPEAAVLERYNRQSGGNQEPPPLKVVHPRRRQTRIRDLRGPVYLLLVIGLGWTAVQHLEKLDPGPLLAWWPRGESNSAPPPASKPMAATTQTQYPFQAAPAEPPHEPAPPAPAPTASEPPSTPNPEPASISTVALSASPALSTEALPTAVIPSIANIAALPALAGSEANSDGLTPDARTGARLALQFSDDCWVEVKDAQGKVLINGLMKANTTHTLSGPAPFTVTLGNAPAARIALDDQPVDKAVYVPRRGTVSRFTLNTQP